MDEMEFLARVETPTALEGELIDADGEWEDEESGLDDLKNGMEIIRSAKRLIDYLSDPTLCKNISKKERGIMAKMSERMRTFLVETEATYGED